MMLSNSECDHSMPSTLHGSFHISEASHCPMRYVRMVIVSILPIRKLSLRRVTILLRAHRWQAVPGTRFWLHARGAFPSVHASAQCLAHSNPHTCSGLHLCV